MSHGRGSADFRHHLLLFKIADAGCNPLESPAEPATKLWQPCKKTSSGWNIKSESLSKRLRRQPLQTIAAHRNRHQIPLGRVSTQRRKRRNLNLGTPSSLSSRSHRNRPHRGLRSRAQSHSLSSQGKDSPIRKLSRDSSIRSLSLSLSRRSR